MDKSSRWAICVLCLFFQHFAIAGDCYKPWEKPLGVRAALPVSDVAAAIKSAKKAANDADSIAKQVGDEVNKAEDNALKLLGEKNNTYGTEDTKVTAACYNSVKTNAIVIWGNLKIIADEVQEATKLFAQAQDEIDADKKGKLLMGASTAASNAMQNAKDTFNWKDENDSSTEDKSRFRKLKDEADIVQVIMDNPRQDNQRPQDSAGVQLHRRQEYSLLTTIDKFPAVASLVGSPGVQFSGSSSGGTAAITASFEQLGLGLGDRYKSLTLSAPTATSGNTNLATLDGLANTTSIRFNDRWNFMPTEARIVTLGFAPQVGYQEHTYFADNTSTKSTKSRDYPAALSAYGGMSVSKNFDQFILFKFQFSKKLVDQDTTTVCSGISVPCSTGSFGAPTRNLSRTFGAEYRYSQSNWAIAPSLNYDSVAKVKGFDLPIYMIPTAKDATPSGLTGGIDIGYRTDTHAKSIAIFIGSTFDLFGVQ